MPKPKILFLDIETQPDLVWTWGVYESNAIAVKEHWQLLSFSAEWLDGKAITKALCDYPGYKPGGGDQALLDDVWELLDEADIVVAHNGIDFDLKKLNARFMASSMMPPSPYKIIDTKRTVKRVANFSSNKLDWLCQQLEIGKKLETQGWSLWKGCMDGDPKAWATMKRYNRHDVELLQQLYSIMSPWISQPNVGMWIGENVCPNPACGSKNLVSRGEQRNKTRLYRRFQCNDCGSWSRSTKAESQRANVVAV